MDMYYDEIMTYKEIQNRYKREFNKTIKSCWIADVKRQLGLPIRTSYNRISLNAVKYPCPNEEIKQRIVNILQTPV